jgi:predicted amidophosphoribosyltransferase
VNEYTATCAACREDGEATHRHCEWCGEPIEDDAEYSRLFRPGYPRFCGQACGEAWATQGDARY